MLVVSLSTGINYLAGDVMAEFHCKDCNKRHLGCHSECEVYLKDKKVHDELKENERLVTQCHPIITEWGYNHDVLSSRKGKQ